MGCLLTRFLKVGIGFIYWEKFLAFHDFKMAKAVGLFIVTLDSNNHFQFWDRLTLAQVYEMPLEPNLRILNFEFLDIAPSEYCFDDAKILLHVDTGNGFEVIKSARF